MVIVGTMVIGVAERMSGFRSVGVNPAALLMGVLREAILTATFCELSKGAFVHGFSSAVFRTSCGLTLRL